MRFITGGYAQGKLEYALKKYNIAGDDAVDAGRVSAEEIASAGLVYNLHEYIRKHHRGGSCQLPEFRSDAVVISDEVGLGVVPLTHEDRAYREAAGRAACALAEKAESVELVRCGIAIRIK